MNYQMESISKEYWISEYPNKLRLKQNYLAHYKDKLQISKYLVQNERNPDLSCTPLYNKISEAEAKRQNIHNQYRKRHQSAQERTTITNQEQYISGNSASFVDQYQALTTQSLDFAKVPPKPIIHKRVSSAQIHKGLKQRVEQNQLMVESNEPQWRPELIEKYRETQREFHRLRKYHTNSTQTKKPKLKLSPEMQPLCESLDDQLLFDRVLNRVARISTNRVQYATSIHSAISDNPSIQYQTDKEFNQLLKKSPPRRKTVHNQINTNMKRQMEKMVQYINRYEKTQVRNAASPKSKYLSLYAWNPVQK